MSIFIGLTTKKNTAPATNTKEIREFIKWPYINLEPFITNVSVLKSGNLPKADIIGKVFLRVLPITKITKYSALSY